ncbi:SWIB/MDM2 domain protein [Talaromyces proteolyticus]|uniref:SWIB/MDM2 domain protein n=1 Tax=Talaromyces proteolyticus TaxID=1131652 RepID=A0AAD4KZE0_9EURO|nr:SWIB/MDM2 domain protein [Talaromyces proteolyticus]KAH8703418.1 SWIB/MDM2 domain protein [Talaromyces proteolyticus]
MSLSSEQRDSFTKVIDSILADSDLNTISSKSIRKGLQEKFPEYNLNEYKDAVKDLIMERFDIFANKNETESTSSEHVVPTTETTNGHKSNGVQAATAISPTPSSTPSRKRESTSEDLEESEPKKRRPEPDVDADALFAAKLQAEENKRARPTRGSATRKSAPAKKKSKSKTAKKVRAEDDSDLESSSETTRKKAVNRSTGFHKPLNLSPALSELLDGELSLSRPQTVKRVWDYIKKNDLQDPTDKRQIRCDDRLRPVFKQDRVHMFTMTKILNQNLYDPGE